MSKNELKQMCLIKINQKINKDICPGKYNKMLTHFWHVAFTYPDIFIPSHLAIYTYLMFWSKDTEIQTDNKIVATYGLCSETTAKLVIKDLMLFGLIERIKRGNGLSRKRSIYRIVGIQESKIIRKKNEKQIIELINKKTKGQNYSSEGRNPPPVKTESTPHWGSESTHYV